MATKPYPQLAGFTDEGTVNAPERIFMSHAEVLTDSAPALANIARLQLLVITATGVRPLANTDIDDTTFLPSAAVQGRLAIAQVAVQSGQQCLYWRAGDFNHEVLGWPTELGTYAKRKFFMGDGPLVIGHLKPGGMA